MFFKPNKRRLSCRLKTNITLLGCTMIYGFFLAKPARPQHRIRSGTAIVLRLDDNKITVASDSRGTDPTTGGNHDDECKVSTLSDKFFFVGSGYLHATVRDPARQVLLTWDAHTLARRAFNATKVDITGVKSVEEITAEWGRLAAETLNGLPVQIRQGLVSRGGFTSSSALFVGLAQSGEIRAYAIRIIFDQIVQNFRADSQPIPFPRGQFSGMARGQEIMKEFLDGISPRSQKAMQDWKSRLGTKNEDEVNHQLVVQLVKWMILYDTSGKVGGVPEAVELSRGGTVHWIARCPAAENH
jgi:hypothetical protein